jgi:hypothetical protein
MTGLNNALIGVAEALAKANEDLGAFLGEHVPSEVETRHGIGYGKVYEEILGISGESKRDVIVMATQRTDSRTISLEPTPRASSSLPAGRY